MVNVTLSVGKNQLNKNVDIKYSAHTKSNNSSLYTKDKRRYPTQIVIKIVIVHVQTLSITLPLHVAFENAIIVTPYGLVYCLLICICHEYSF